MILPRMSDKASTILSPANEMLELSIIMPCLNEAETLETCIRKARKSLDKNQIQGEIIVADNGSTDGSQSIALKLGARVIRVAPEGYGNAVLKGIAAARGRFIIMGDADDSYDFSNLEPFIEKLRAGYDLVIGNRFKGGIKKGAMPFLHRYLGNPVLTQIGRFFFRSAVGDFHCGLRGFSQEAAKKMNLQTTGMEFASEMVVKATLLGLCIAEVPTSLSPDGRSRKPHLRSWRDGWRHLRFMLLYCPRWLFFYPGLLLMMTGTAIILWLLPGSRHIGNLTVDVHTVLYAAAFVLVGFQAVLFSALAKVFAITEGLLPEDPNMMRIFKYINLETGLAVGLALILFGSAGTLLAIWRWYQASFGNLDPTQIMRIVIPCILALVLGCQVVLASFFFSILGIKRL
ncbi:MAG: glycosyltransferase family 2 protein [Deltaproteobacteria bacterium]|jgi:glycosyltransferase involved in cell wall biosynthesis